MIYGVNLEMLTAINLYKRDLNRAYEVKAEQIRSGNYTEEDVREAERLYNLSKATTEREYEIMLEYAKQYAKQIASVFKNIVSNVKNIFSKAGNIFMKIIVILLLHMLVLVQL